MAFQAVPNTASFRFVMQGGGTTDLISTVYARNTVNPWTGAHLQALADALRDEWASELVPSLHPSVTFLEVQARDEGAEFGASATALSGAVGTTAGERASFALCAGLKLVGAGGGAPRQGRLFISGWGENAFNGDAFLFGPAVVGPLAAAIDAAIAADAFSAWVIVSRFSKNAVPVPPHKRAVAETNTVATTLFQTDVWTQRDRRAWLGP